VIIQPDHYLRAFDADSDDEEEEEETTESDCDCSYLHTQTNLKFPQFLKYIHEEWTVMVHHNDITTSVRFPRHLSISKLREYLCDDVFETEREGGCIFPIFADHGHHIVRSFEDEDWDDQAPHDLWFYSLPATSEQVMESSLHVVFSVSADAKTSSDQFGAFFSLVSRVSDLKKYVVDASYLEQGASQLRVLELDEYGIRAVLGDSRELRKVVYPLRVERIPEAQESLPDEDLVIVVCDFRGQDRMTFLERKDGTATFGQFKAQLRASLSGRKRDLDRVMETASSSFEAINERGSRLELNDGTRMHDVDSGVYRLMICPKKS
jgi:hypothetical protein